MSAPTPRTGDLPAGVAGEFAYGLLVAQLTRVENGVQQLNAEVTRRFDALPERFVPRAEIAAFQRTSEQDRAELRSLLASETGHREDAIRRVDERITAEARERANDRKWALGLLATILIAISGEGITLFTHFH